MMTEQILACPYCGSEEGKVFTTSAGKRFYVGSPCGASGPVADNESDAVLFWNAAANALAAKDAEIERLTEACDDMQGEFLRMKEHSENLLLRINQLTEYKEIWYKRALESLDQRDEARRVARQLYATNKELIDTFARQPIGDTAYIGYRTRNELPTSRVDATEE